jgi:hypothetical protein
MSARLRETPSKYPVLYLRKFPPLSFITHMIVPPFGVYPIGGNLIKDLTL